MIDKKGAIYKNRFLLVGLTATILILMAFMVFATSYTFNTPTANSRVKASTSNVVVFKFNLTNSDGTILGTAPAAGSALDATETWSNIKFYDGGDNTWAGTSDWIGFDNDTDSNYTAQIDTLVDADGSTTLGAGSTALATGTALVQYATGNGAGNALCVNSLTSPTAVRLDDANDCTDASTKAGTYIKDAAAVAATATLTADKKSLLANNEYFIITDNAAAGDAVCFYFDVTGALANDGATSAECQAANGVAGGVEVDVSGATTQAQVATAIHNAINGVAGELLVTSTNNNNAVAAKATMTLDTKANFVNNDYFILTDNAAAGDAVCFYVDTNNGLASDAGTAAACQAANGVAGGIEVDLSSASTAIEVAAAFHAAINGVVAELTLTSTDHLNGTLLLTYDETGTIGNIALDANYLTEAVAGGASALTALSGGVNPTLTLTQDASGTAWNIALDANYLAESAGGASALTAFTGGDNTAAALEADGTYAFESAGTAGVYELGEDIFLNAGPTYSAAADTRIAGNATMVHGTALTAQDVWSDIRFYDAVGAGTWEQASDLIAMSDDAYYLDVLQNFAISNTGTAVDSTDISNVTIYQGASCSGTNSALTFGAGKWSVTGINWDTTSGFDTYTVCAGISATPTNDRTIIMSVTASDIVMAGADLPASDSTASGTITIDTTLPTITSTAPVASQKKNNQQINYTLSEAVASATVVFTRASGAADAASPHTCTLQGTALNSGAHNDLTLAAGVNACAAWTALVDGTTYDVTFDATDLAGNAATTVTNTGVVYDTTSPSGYTVNIDQAYVNNANKGAVSFTFASAEVGATYFYNLSNGTVDVTASGTIATATDVISGINAASLGDGTLTLTVTLTDVAGNTGTAVTDTVTKDVVAPSGYTVNIDQSYVNNANKAAISFTFAGAEVGASYHFNLSNSTANVSGVGTIATATDTISGIDTTSIGDGTLALSVILTDVAGNAGTAATDTVTKDVALPTFTARRINTTTIVLTFTEPVSASDTATAAWTLSAGSVSAVTQPSNEYTLNITTTGISGTSATPTVTYVAAQGTVADVAANEVANGANAVSTDGVSPTVALTYSANPATVGALTITATYSEAIVGTPQISINQQGTTDVTTQNMAGGATIWTYVYTVTAHDGATYADGTATVSLSTVADGASNNANAPTGTTFYIDTISPVLNLFVSPDTDNFYSVFDKWVNIRVNLTDNSTGILYAQANFTNISGVTCTSGGYLNLTLNTTTGFYEGRCDISSGITAEQYPAQAGIRVYAYDNATNYITGAPITVLLHDLGTPDMGDGSCFAFGDLTTNFTEELDFTNINFVMHLQRNMSCFGGSNTMVDAALINLTSVNLSTQEAAQKLAGLANAISVNITQPNTFGNSRIYINSTYFAELDTDAVIKLFFLPFAQTPSIIADGDAAGTSGTVTWVSNGVDPTGILTGNLTFTVLGFSGYDVGDNVTPTITYSNPLNTTYVTSSSTITYSVVLNGTGTRLSYAMFNLTNSTGGSQVFTYAPQGANTAGCVNASEGSDVFTCTFVAQTNQGANTLAVVAVDYGAVSGNTKSSSISFTVDTAAPVVTTLSPGSAVTYPTSTVTLNLTQVEAATTLQNCWYSLDTGANTTITCNSATTLTALTDGTHIVRAYANDSANNVGISATTFYVDQVAVFTTSSVSPASGSQYVTGQLQQFNASFTDNDFLTAYINLNGTNYAMTNLSTTLFTRTFDLIPGTYTYYFWANDSDNVTTSTSSNYTLLKGTGAVALTVNGTTSNLVVSENTVLPTNLSLTTGTNAVLALYKDGVLINSGNVASLSNLTNFTTAGNYNFTATWAGNENFTAAVAGPIWVTVTGSNTTSATNSSVTVNGNTTEVVEPVGVNVTTVVVNNSISTSTPITLNVFPSVTSGNYTVDGGNLTLVREASSTVNYTVTIPQNTVISGGSSWDGRIILPTVNVSSHTAPSGSVDVVVEMGNAERLNFTQPIKIVIAGQGGSTQRAAWASSGSSSLNEITTVCDSSTAPTNVPANGECYIKENGDMIIWTYHMTKYAAYTLPAATTSSSSSGNSGVSLPTTGIGTSKLWDSIPAGSAVTFTLTDSNIPVTKVMFTLTSTASNAQLSVSSLYKKPVTVTEANATGSNYPKVYKYLEITKQNIADTSLTNGQIEFTVEKSWLTANSIKEENVVLLRWSNNAWQKLTTTKVSSTTTSITYRASTPGFSYFVIAAEKASTAVPQQTTTPTLPTVEPTTPSTTGNVVAETPKETAPVETTPTETAPSAAVPSEQNTQGTVEAGKKSVLGWVIAASVALVVVALFVYLFYAKKVEGEEHKK